MTEVTITMQISPDAFRRLKTVWEQTDQKGSLDQFASSMILAGLDDFDDEKDDSR